MKKLVLLLIFGILQNGWSQWEGNHNGLPQSINSIAVSGNKIFVGTNHTGFYNSYNNCIFYSSDNGNNWVSKNDGLTQSTIYSIAFSGNYIVAAGHNGSVFFSTDNGDNWTEKILYIYDPYRVDPNIRAIYVTGNYVFAATNFGLFLTHDYGNHWNQLIWWTDRPSVDAITFSDKNIYVVTDSREIHLTTDLGITWIEKKLLNDCFIYFTINSIAAMENFVFVGTTKGIYVSSDNGNIWIQKNNGLADTNIRYVTTCGKNIFAVNEDGIYSSADFGNNWVFKNTGLPTKLIGVLAGNENFIYAATDSGLYISSDFGNKWNAQKNRLTCPYVCSIGILDDNIIASTPDGIYKSNDNGFNWYNKTGIETGKLATSGNTMLAETYNGIYFSNDNGETWSEFKGSPFGPFINDMVVSGDKILVGTDGAGLFYSSDFGTNWTRQNLPPFIYSLALYNNTLYAGTSSCFFISTDLGNSWIEKNKGLDDGYEDYMVYSILVSGNTIFAGTVGGGLFMSTNNGNKWFPRFNRTGDTVYAIANYGNNIFFGSYENGMFISTDNGINWRPINDGLTSKKIRTLTISGNYIYAGTWGGGVFRANLNDFGITGVKDNEQKSDITLYPNPATEFINIYSPYYFGENIEIYNLLGTKLMSIPAVKMNTRLNISSFPGGLYLIKIGDQSNIFMKE